MKFDSFKDLENKIPKKGSFKHMLRRMDEDGRIVKGVNTTPDVDVNQIPKEAGKFGNKVDKDGRPPTLSTKVKGKSTNVLFNLGMVAEGKSPHKKGTKKYKKHMAAKHAAMSESELFDAINDLSPNSKIYVDMDGVLADFFGSWAKLMGKKDWRAIDDIKSGLEKIKQTDNFWLNLPLTANAKNLLSLIKQVKGKYSILSSPLPGDKNSEPHKREWIKKNLGFFPPEEVIITHDKAKYANAGGIANVLIDDYGQNIQKWEGAGGVGFKHKDHKFERTAKNIKQAIDTPAQEGKMIPNPKNSFAAGADTAYDFYKLGVNMANLKSMPDNSNVGEPDIMIAPYAGKKEMKYLMKQLKRLGYKVGDISGYQDTHIKDEGIEPPQIKGEGRLGKLKLSKIRPVQRKRKFKKLFSQLVKVGENNYAPITIDRTGRIVNGHHRYDALRLYDQEYAIVRMLDKSLEEVMDEGITDKLSGFADKILGKMEKWWNKQVNAHEMAWAEVEKILKPYAEELRDLIKDPNDFGMLMLLIKHNQGKKPLLDKLFAKIRQFGIKAVYKMQGLEDKFATEDIEEGSQLDSLKKFVRSQREAPDQVLYQIMMAPDTYGHSISDFVRSWYERTKEENGLNDVDSALEMMVDELGLNENSMDDKTKGAIDKYQQTNTVGKTSRAFTDIEEEYLNIRELALKLMKNGLDAYTAYYKASEKMQFDPAMVFDWMGSEFKDEELEDFIPIEYERDWIKRAELGMSENFADGKKPGRKGLAKRKGVNCSQSVTKLRKIAKNSSGEKQRMAHWCANMKSGKSKKK